MLAIQKADKCVYKGVPSLKSKCACAVAQGPVLSDLPACFQGKNMLLPRPDAYEEQPQGLQMPEGPLHLQILGVCPVRQRTTLLFPSLVWLIGKQPPFYASSSVACNSSLLPMLPRPHTHRRSKIARQKALQACYDTPTQLPGLSMERQLLLQLLNPDAQPLHPQQPLNMKFTQGEKAQHHTSTSLLSNSLRCLAVSSGCRFVQNLTASEPLLLYNSLRTGDCDESLLQIVRKVLPLSHEDLVRASCIDSATLKFAVDFQSTCLAVMRKVPP